MALLTRRRRGGEPERQVERPGPMALRDEIDRLFDDFLSGWPVSSALTNRGEFIPTIDLSETDGEVKVTAELPGMSEEDVDVELDEDRLTIRGEKSDLPDAIHHAKAVATTIQDAITAGEGKDIAQQLPPEYADLFEREFKEG